MLTVRLFKGNSIRFNIEYKDLNDNPSVPTTPLFKVYDSRYVEIHSVPVDTNNILLDSVGDPIPGGYYMEYTFANSNEFVVEFSGVFVTKTTLTRQKVKVVFV